MSDEARWKIAQSHMSGHLAGNEPDPGEFLRRGAAESVGYRMGQNSTDSRAELARNGGPESVITRAVQRAENQIRTSDAQAGELTRQAAILKAKLRGGS